MLGTQGSHQLLVGGLVTVLSNDTQQGLDSLPETSDKSIRDQGLLQNLLEGRVNIHGSSHSGDSRWNISFNITHVEFLEAWVSVVEK